MKVIILLAFLHSCNSAKQCEESVSITGNPHGILHESTSMVCEFFCPEPHCDQLASVRWHIGGTYVYLYMEGDKSSTGPLPGTQYEHNLAGWKEGHHRHVLHIKEVTCQYHQHIECEVETVQCMDGIRDDKHLQIVGSPSGVHLEVEDKLLQHGNMITLSATSTSVRCRAISNPKSTILIEVGAYEYNTCTVCSPDGDCGQYECTTSVYKVQVHDNLDISCNVIYHSEISGDNTIKADSSGAYGTLTVIKHESNERSIFFTMLIFFGVCGMFFWCLFIVVYIRNKSFFKSVGAFIRLARGQTVAASALLIKGEELLMEEANEPHVAQYSPVQVRHRSVYKFSAVIKEQMSLVLPFQAYWIVGIGCQGTVVVEEFKSPNNLHKFSWDNGYKHEWRKSKPEGTAALCYKNIAEDGQIYLSAEQWKGTILYSLDFKKTAQFKWNLLQCLSNGKLAYIGYTPQQECFVNVVQGKKEIHLNPHTLHKQHLSGFSVCDDLISGKLAMTERLSKTLSLYEPNGQLIRKINLPWEPHWPHAVTSVEGQYIVVAKTGNPPALAFYTWTGEEITQLTADDLDLDTNDSLKAVQYSDDGFMHVAVGDTIDNVDSLCAYKLDLSGLLPSSTSV